MSRKRWQTVLGVTALLALALGMIWPGSAAGSPALETSATFVEDFSSTTYKGPTSDVIWDTTDHELYLASRESEQFGPALAVGTQGRTFLAWWDSRSATRRVYFNWFDAEGDRLLPADDYLTAGTLPDDNPVYPGGHYYGGPVAAAGPDGNVVIAWPARIDGLYTILVQKISPAGEKLWSGHKPVQSYGSDAELGQAAVDVGPDGDAVVTWSVGRYTDPEGTMHVMAQRFSPGGAREWGDGVQVDDLTLLNYHDGSSSLFPTRPSSARVAVTASGLAFIVMDANPDIPEVRSSMAVQKLSTSGVRLWSEDRMIRNSLDKITTISAETFAGESLLVPQIQYIDSSDAYLLVMVVEPDGLTTSFLPSPCEMDWSGSNNCLSYSAAVVDGDDIWYAWYREKPGMFAQKYMDGEDPAAMTAIGTNGFSIKISSADDSDDQASAVFIPNRENPRLWMARVNSSGGLVGGDAFRVVPQDNLYAATGTAESKKVSGSFGMVGTAMLTADMALNGGTAAFEVSNNGGSTWQPAVLGETVTFPSAGSDLRWRVRLASSANGAASPVLHRVAIDYSAPVVNTRTPTPTATATATATATMTATATQPPQPDLPYDLFLPWVKR